ncbi:flagellar hook-associated protein FlgL [Desulforegula conservatrix]|uniref:flagellar hook-associated protein FlgL n=1 Tax=Desulforegula conservatrix TaxID=153026 RepID=UPI000405C8B9|nr:flagellar hook-associated protein FlgL [Desulforegula conservatrix]
MRVANRSIYEMTSYRLGQRTDDLYKANEVIATGKRINNLSDDPVGLTQVMNLKASSSTLDQYNLNISSGRMWLNAGETALTNAENEILSIKTTSLKMADASVNPAQRKDAIAKVEAAIGQLLSLGNTTVNNHHVFAGKRTDSPALVMKDGKVDYAGDDEAFLVKMDLATDVEVGSVGKNIFWENFVKVDSTNNMIDFTEDTGKGHEIMNIHAEGENAASDVSLAVNDRSLLIYGTPRPSNEAEAKEVLGTEYPPGPLPMTFTWEESSQSWKVENDPGYGLPERISGTSSTLDIDLNDDGTNDVSMQLKKAAKDGDNVEFDLVRKSIELKAEIPDGKYEGAELAVAMENAMTKASEASGYKVKYKVSFDEDTKKFSIKEDGSYPGFVQFNMLWKTGDNASRSIAPDLGFDPVDEVRIPATSDVAVKNISITNANNRLDFRENDGTGWSPQINVEIPVGDYSEEGLAHAIEFAMRQASNTVGYDSQFDVMFSRQVTGLNSTLGGPPVITITNPDALTFSTPVPAVSSQLGFTYDGAGNWTVANDPGYNLPLTLTGTATTLNIDFNGDATPDMTLDMTANPAGAGDSVAFDLTPFYSINSPAGNTGLEMLWNTGNYNTRTIAGAIGFNPAADSVGTVNYTAANTVRNITIANAGVGQNNRINFRELPRDGQISQELTAEIPPGNYTSDELADVIEKEMERVSRYDIDYSVTYDAETGKFAFKENGSSLDELQLLWESGTDGSLGTGTSAASALGFDNDDDVITEIKSDDEAEWGIFRTLSELKTYLENNDTQGVERTISRLDIHYAHMVETVSDIGNRDNRFMTRESIISDLTMSYTERRVNLEEADFVKAVSDLQAKELAYQASLSSSAKVMKMSLVDYM